MIEGGVIEPGSTWQYVGRAPGKNLVHMLVAVDTFNDQEPWMTTFSLTEQPHAVNLPDEVAGYTWRGPADKFLRAFKPV